jgi:uncharacterized membrane protein
MTSYSEIFAGLALSLIGLYVMILLGTALVAAYKNRNISNTPDSNGVVRSRDIIVEIITQDDL